MRVSALIVAALCSASALAQAVDESNVIVLTNDNFDSTIKAHDHILVEFYAPWCGHCKKLVPEYAAAATTLKGKVALAKVDATVETDVAGKYEIQGYPTLKFFRNGEASDYTGGRTANDIVNWLNKNTGPPSTELASEADVETFTKDKAAVVGTFKSRDSAEYKNFIAAAKSAALEDFVFGDLIGSTVGVKLYTKFTTPQTWDGAGELSTWVLTNGYPLVDEIPDAIARYQKLGLLVGLLFVNKAEDNTANLAVLNEAATTLKGKYAFAYADGVRFKTQIERMGASGDKLPVLISFNLQKNNKNVAYTGDLNAKDIVAFANGVLDGSIKPIAKSEPVPESNDGPVKVVVGSTFKDTINSGKDVLLEIYAPWCGHCKALAPTWDQLGEHFSSNSNLVIAKLDGTTNDIDVEYRGFPTIKFFPGGAGLEGMVDYDGGRTLEDLKTWLNKNAKSVSGTAKGHSEL